MGKEWATCNGGVLNPHLCEVHRPVFCNTLDGIVGGKLEASLCNILSRGAWSSSVILKVGTSFSRSTACGISLASCGVFWALNNAFTASSARTTGYDAGPSLPRSQWSQGVLTAVLLQGATLGLLWQPAHPCHWLCSQGHCLWRVSHTFFSATGIWGQ